MTKETQNHVMTRTMELRRRVDLVCYPKLCETDFGETNLNLAERLTSDCKFDQDRKRDCNIRDLNKMEELI